MVEMGDFWHEEYLGYAVTTWLEIGNNECINQLPVSHSVSLSVNQSAMC